jgi:hypothetical protein
MKAFLVLAGLILAGTHAYAESQDVCEVVPQAPWCKKKTSESQDVCDVVPQAPWCNKKNG